MNVMPGNPSFTAKTSAFNANLRLPATRGVNAGLVPSRGETALSFVLGIIVGAIGLFVLGVYLTR